MEFYDETVKTAYFVKVMVIFSWTVFCYFQWSEQVYFRNNVFMNVNSTVVKVTGMNKGRWCRKSYKWYLLRQLIS
jgi:hypothetical protein